MLADKEPLSWWEAKAKPAAKAYRDKRGPADPVVHQEWLHSIGVRPGVTHVVAVPAWNDSIVKQANELRKSQSRPGRPMLGAFP